MENLVIESTDDTPKVMFDAEKGLFEISLRSLPEDSGNFYGPIIEWFENYMRSPKEESHFIFHFEYISTSSTKQIMRLFLLVNELVKTKKVNVTWRYDKDDEDMMQTGKRLQKLTTVPFKYEEV